MIVSATSGVAGEFKDFMAASKQALDHNRSADFYLRTGNFGIAVFELQAMAETWGAARKRFEKSPPDPFAEDPKWSDAVTDISKGIELALAQSQGGETEKARDTVRSLRRLFSHLRQRNQVTTFADCIEELNAATAKIWRFRRAPPEFDSPDQIDEFKAEVAVVAYLFRKCRDRAPKTYRADEMFERLFSESLAAIGRFDPALQNKNRRLLIDTLRELRSFDRMIFLRYG